MKLNRLCVVLSACRGVDATTDALATAELSSRLTHECFEFDRAEGCYKGVKEVSFVVQAGSFQEVLEVMQMSADFEQESVMLVDARNKAYILFNDKPDMVALGKLNESTYEPMSEYVESYTKLGAVYYYTYNFNQGGLTCLTGL